MLTLVLIRYEEATAKDALKDLFLISEGGLKVVTEERYRRTVVTAIPDEIRNIKDETWIPECIRIFSSDWTVVQNPEEDRGRCALTTSIHITVCALTSCAQMTRVPH